VLRIEGDCGYCEGGDSSESQHLLNRISIKCFLLKRIVKPEGSISLSIWNILIDYGIEPPVVTDDWWLDVVKFSGLNYREQHWGFPLSQSFSKSWRIAWATMQMTWQQRRKIRSISQISKPEEVLNFIKDSRVWKRLVTYIPNI
jgi:hypothetical protein